MATSTSSSYVQICPPKCTEKKLSKNKEKIMLGHLFEEFISDWDSESYF